MFVSQIIDEAAEILATTDQNKIFRKLTQAVQTLMESGHYFHLNQEVDVCTGWDGQTITLPRGIEVPLGVNVDGSPTYFRGRLFQYHVNKGGMYNPVDWAWDDRGFVSTVMDIRQPSQLVAVAEHAADAGVQLRVIGTDGNNRELRSQTDDGMGIDGLIVPVHSQNDFAYGTIQPDGVTIQTRSSAVSPLSRLISQVAHSLSTGQSAVLSLVSGTMPSVLIAGNTYYVGLSTSPNDTTGVKTIVLYQNFLDAQAKNNPIQLSSIIGSGTVRLTDTRSANLLTTVNLLPPGGTVPITIDTPNEVTFSIGGAIAQAIVSSGGVVNLTLIYGGTQYTSVPTIKFTGGGGTGASATAVVSNGVVTGFIGIVPGTGYTSAPIVTFSAPGGSLPSPVISDLTYFATPQDNTNLNIYSSFQDAQNGTNQIALTGNSGQFNVDIRKPIAPQTTFQFAVPHYYSQGDAVQAFTSGGTLPSPLIAGQNYFVNVVDSQTVTLHISQTDANASTNLIFVKPIILTDSGAGTNSLVKLIPATATTGTTNQITAPGLTFTTPTPLVSASATATVVGSVTSVTINTVGAKYGAGVIPTVTFSDPPSVTGQITKPATGYAVMQLDQVGSITYGVGGIVITDAGQGYRLGQPPTITFNPLPSGTGAIPPAATAVLKTSNVSQINLTNPGLGYAQPPKVIISQGGGTGATANCTLDNRIVSITGITRTGTIATVTTGTAHGYATNDQVIISGANPTGYNGQKTITVATAFTFTYTCDPALTTPATGTISVTTGKITAINVITNGTGYTLTPTVTILPSSGVYVEFTSTGTLPSPIVSGVAYLAENSASGGVFTVTNADFTEINITSSATGNLYVALARSFSIGFNNYWSGDFAGISTGQGIYMASDYVLPLGVTNSTLYYIRKSDSSTLQIFDTQANANGLTSTGLIKIIGLGSGQAYYAIRIPAYAKAYNNLVNVPNTGFLSNGEKVSFTSTGSLPYPLVAYNTQTGAGLYSITIIGNNVSLTDSLGADVVFSNSGKPTLATGNLSLNVINDFTFLPSTSIVADNYLFETGDQITVRANTNDVLPNGLVASTITTPQYYYVRRVDDASYELYDTRANAINLSGTTGRKTFINIGNTISSTFFADLLFAPTLVKSVLHIEKPVTRGYISLYAYDYGRSNDMALIGQYHPTETNPKYRRIRIGKQCSWARIIYRMKSPEISSVYDYIPVENQRAIIAAVHAVDLEDKDFIDQSQKYWAIAYNYLKSQNESMDGHAMQPPQINNITYGDGTDVIMF